LTRLLLPTSETQKIPSVRGHLRCFPAWGRGGALLSPRSRCIGVLTPTLLYAACTPSPEGCEANDGCPRARCPLPRVPPRWP
jgi:hypothetical protein